jgi:hypothetical protein
MTDQQMLVFGGAVVLFGMSQPIMSLAWVLVTVLGVLPEDYRTMGFAVFFGIAMYLNFRKAAK